MVSLLRSFNTNSGGATFFSESVNMEEQAHLQPILDSYGIFRPIKTIPYFSLHLVFTLILDIVAINYAIVHPDQKSKCREYFTIIYIHIGLWFLTLLLHIVAKHSHHKLRMNGYLEFYKLTEVHVNLPLMVVSFWTVVLMFLQTLMQHFYPDNFAEKCIKGGSMSPIGYISAVITVEFCVIAGININYIFTILAFNKKQPPPDVQRTEWLACSSPESFCQTEVGYQELGDKLNDFLEKQADLIKYLKEHNNRLSEKVMILSTQLAQYNSKRRTNSSS